MRWRSAFALSPLTLLLVVLNTVAHATPGPSIATGSLITARTQHTATLLPGGKVLVAGGRTDTTPGLSSAELYDPNTGTWMPTGSLNVARFRHTATLLQNGKVLIAGGANFSAPFTYSAELYDPSTGTWTLTGSMNEKRQLHTATLLPSGKVLVAGGGPIDVNSAELYDPVAAAWMWTGSMHVGHGGHTATLLQNGKVLVAGGLKPDWRHPNIPEVYDPITGLWTVTGSMGDERQAHTAALLPSGKVLIAGAAVSFGLDVVSAELYDPGTNFWTATGSLSDARTQHTATPLPNGNVLVAGGSGATAVLSSAELYNSSTGVWTAIGGLITARTQHTATLLPTGKVLVAGGYNATALRSAELFDANFPVPPAITSVSNATFTAATVGRFTVTATGNPSPSLSVTGTLPAGVTFTSASGLLSGTPTASGTFPLTFTATNGVPPNAIQNFTLTVNPAPPAVLTSPTPGSALIAAAQLFTWDSVVTADQYSLWAGSAVGGYDFYNTYCLCTSTTVTGLPTDGSTVFVRLWTHTPDGWSSNDYSFTAIRYAVITSPAPGSTLSGASVPFSWTSVASATEYSLWAGSTLGGYDYFYAYCLCTGTTVTGLPINGSTVYVRMWTRTPADNYTFTDYIYNPASYAVITTPVPGSTLSGASVPFSWTSAATADNYSLWAGSTVGGYDFYNTYCLCTSTTVTGLPTNGSTVFVRMWTHTTANGWTFIDYTYIAAAAP